MKKTNILILSCGTRNKIIEYFKTSLANNGKVIATDSNFLAPALYIADKFYLVPEYDNKDYLDKILEICKIENICAVLSLVDPELSIISKNNNIFRNNNITPIISDHTIVKNSSDKYTFYKTLKEKGFPTINTFESINDFKLSLKKGEINWPVFVKPKYGSASINTNLVNNENELNIIFNNNPDMIIQEYVRGIELGADLYLDLIDNQVKSIFIKEKIRMRAGETDKSVSFKDESLFELLINFSENMGYRGPIDIDIFKTSKGYLISEVNPRFGGGYPHAFEAGLNFPEKIINNLLGNVNKREIGKYSSDFYMMKYNEVSFIKTK